jgi:hypothetical protein
VVPGLHGQTTNVSCEYGIGPGSIQDHASRYGTPISGDHAPSTIHAVERLGGGGFKDSNAWGSFHLLKEEIIELQPRQNGAWRFA